MTLKKAKKQSFSCGFGEAFYVCVVLMSHRFQMSFAHTLSWTRHALNLALPSDTYTFLGVFLFCGCFVSHFNL